ncbi:MAG TPA: hypothetical protein VFD39_11260, partial [Trueperaceae bacterium]|nr:hypothetical protein [Trueperaceae bacterium]
MSDFTVRELDESTWYAFAALVERHNGVWGGCWCMIFHPREPGSTMATYREDKEALVRAGHAHAALVFDGELCAGWCQHGPLSELPQIKRQKAYDVGLTELPDWRITCFFVDKRYRRRGVTEFALKGALRAIASQGGGVVESYPEDVTDRKTSSSFLHNATTRLFERNGFGRGRQIGMHHWVVSRVVSRVVSEVEEPG